MKEIIIPTLSVFSQQIVLPYSLGRAWEGRAVSPVYFLGKQNKQTLVLCFGDNELLEVVGNVCGVW